VSAEVRVGMIRAKKEKVVHEQYVRRLAAEAVKTEEVQAALSQAQVYIDI